MEEAYSKYVTSNGKLVSLNIGFDLHMKSTTNISLEYIMRLNGDFTDNGPVFSNVLCCVLFGVLVWN